MAHFESALLDLVGRQIEFLFCSNEKQKSNQIRRRRSFAKQLYLFPALKGLLAPFSPKLPLYPNLQRCSRNAHFRFCNCFDFLWQRFSFDACEMKYDFEELPF